MSAPEMLSLLLVLAGLGIGLTRFNPLLASPRSTMRVIAVLAMMAASFVLFLLVGD